MCTLFDGASAASRNDAMIFVSSVHCKARVGEVVSVPQDYVGVSALEMWHLQFGRVARFLSHMEQHMLGASW